MGEQDPELQGDSESSNTENTAPGKCGLTAMAHVGPVLALLQCLLRIDHDLNIVFAIVWYQQVLKHACQGYRYCGVLHVCEQCCVGLQRYESDHINNSILFEVFEKQQWPCLSKSMPSQGFCGDSPLYLMPQA